MYRPQLSHERPRIDSDEGHSSQVRGKPACPSRRRDHLLLAHGNAAGAQDLYDCRPDRHANHT